MARPRKRWEILPSAPPETLARFADLPPLVVQLLYNRQIRDSAEAQAFLSRASGVDSPFLLKGMNRAVARLRQAIRASEPIAVYGDYDVDGVAATALLVPTLHALGAQVVPYIPNRLEEGYGLNIPALESLARDGIRLVVSVDCGVRSVAEAEFAQRIGLDLVITDHHAVGDELPAAVAVIDPRQADDPYPYKHLAGVGLAFKLGQALLRVERQVPARASLPDAAPVTLPQEEDWLDLVALGTVADLAPLTGENRALVSRGLDKLREARRPGVAAMLAEAGLQALHVGATTVSFVLGPRLNAAGRLEHAMASYRLLTTSSAGEAAALAQQLGAQNTERQQRMTDMVNQARQQVLAWGEDTIYVLAAPTYSVGIAGLVASRITEEFYRPTLVIALEEGQSRGSARSIEGLHITRALDECRHLLLHHGGHAAAAGFHIANDKIDALRSQLRDIAARELASEDLVPPLRIDMGLPLSQAGWETLSLVESLQPFGVGNPQPTFVSRGVQVRGYRWVGSEGTTLKLKLSDGRAVWDAVAFRQEGTSDGVPPCIDVVYALQASLWNNDQRLELLVKDWRPAGDEGAPAIAPDPTVGGQTEA